MGEITAPGFSLRPERFDRKTDEKVTSSFSEHDQPLVP